MVRLTHRGVPVEWAEDLNALWAWDLSRLATAP